MYLESFKQLTVWQRAMELVKETYLVTGHFPRSELYGLVNQMRRSAVSIPSNIAEGEKRKTTKDFLLFLRMADGSAAELETQVLIAKSLYTDINFFRQENLLTEVQKMLNAIIKKLEAKL